MFNLGSVMFNHLKWNFFEPSNKQMIAFIWLLPVGQWAAKPKSFSESFKFTPTCIISMHAIRVTFLPRKCHQNRMCFMPRFLSPVINNPVIYIAWLNDELGTVPLIIQIICMTQNHKSQIHSENPSAGTAGFYDW